MIRSHYKINLVYSFNYASNVLDNLSKTFTKKTFPGEITFPEWTFHCKTYPTKLRS